MGHGWLVQRNVARLVDRSKRNSRLVHMRIWNIKFIDWTVLKGGLVEVGIWSGKLRWNIWTRRTIIKNVIDLRKEKTFCFVSVREAAKNFYINGHVIKEGGGGRGKGLAIRKKGLFLRRPKFQRPLSSKGGGVRP